MPRRRPQAPNANLKKGKPDLKSAAKLAFGPDGILFIGDTAGAAIFAIDTGDKAESAEKARVELKDVSGKVASMLGTDARQITINDLASIRGREMSIWRFRAAVGPMRLRSSYA